MYPVEAEQVTPPPPAIISYPDANQPRPSGLATGINGRNASKPYFVLHVGPPKTATTTLQTELTHYQRALAEDDYGYLGQRMVNPDNMWDHEHGELLLMLQDRDCQKHVHEARINGHRPWPRCWRRFLQVLKLRRHEGRSVILSEENLAIKYTDFGDGIGRTSIDWPALNMALKYQGWEPLVIVGYRRLYDIMPSAKQQWDRWTKVNPGLREWPPVGRHLQPLFPNVLEDPRLYDGYVAKYIPRTIQWSYTDHLVKMISPHIPVRLLNMHDPSSIRTTFLCQVLPHAPGACRQSRIDDEQADGELHRNSEESLFYDAITTAAADRGWFNTDLLRRRVVGLAVRDYYEQERHEDPKNLPLICPNTTELEILLDRSLIKEEQILTAAVAETMREEHIQGFWKSVDKHKFCWIDIDKTLEDPHWEQFFREIVPWGKEEGYNDDDGDDGGDDGGDYDDGSYDDDGELSTTREKN
jgi:hypothetical protein